MTYRSRYGWSCLGFSAFFLLLACGSLAVPLMGGGADFILASLGCGWIAWIGLILAISAFGMRFHLDVDGLHTTRLFGLAEYCQSWHLLRSWKIMKKIDLESKVITWCVEFDFVDYWKFPIDEHEVSNPGFAPFIDELREFAAHREEAGSEPWPPMRVEMNNNITYDGRDSQPASV